MGWGLWEDSRRDEVQREDDEPADERAARGPHRAEVVELEERGEEDAVPHRPGYGEEDGESVG